MDERERQYREYLVMREKAAERHRTEELYRTEARGRHERDEQMRAYLAEREANRRRDTHRENPPRGHSRRPAGGPKTADRRSSERRRRKKRKQIFKNTATMFIILILIGACLLGGGILLVKNILNNVTHIPIDQTQIGIDPVVDQELAGYRNIAILGIDARDMNDASDARSDCVIVASLNKETNEIKMFSVYRDTMFYLGENNGLDKMAHAYFYGGAQQALWTLNKNMDLNIHEVVVVNWKAVADTVDALGGVEVDVEQSAIGELNKYIPETARNVGGEATKVTEPGLQTLNGVQAVTYARIRKDAATGDYRRNERMKIVVQAMFDKAKEIDVRAIRKISKDIMPQIMTNMTSNDMMKLLIKMPKYEMNDSTTGFPYEVGSWTGRAWYGPPKNLSSNVTKLHEQFFDQQGYTPTQEVQDISDMIIYRTGIY